MNFLLGLIPAPYQLLAKFIGGALIVIAIWFAYHEFTGHYVDQGKAQQLAIDQPKIDALTTAYNSLESATQEQNTAINKLHDDGIRKQQAAQAAIKSADAKATYTQGILNAIDARDRSQKVRTCEQAVSDAKGDLK
jgi:cell division protein FtsB